MPHLYVRASTLRHVERRISYLINPDLQEWLLAVHDSTTDLLDGLYWHQLAKESRDAFKTFSNKTRMVENRESGEMIEKKLYCCQGRELTIQLSNSLLQRMQPSEIADIIVNEFKSKLSLDVIAVVHLKHFAERQNNLHVHVIFSVRKLLQEPVIKVAERNLFFDAKGKRCYKKSDIYNENKQLLPRCRIVRKGEVYERRFFSSVNKEFYSKVWLKNIKTFVILPLRNDALKGDVEITEYNPITGKLPQQHIGYLQNCHNDAVRAVAKRIEEYNDIVRDYNHMVESREFLSDHTHTLYEQL